MQVQTGPGQIIIYKLSAYLIVWIFRTKLSKICLYTYTVLYIIPFKANSTWRIRVCEIIVFLLTSSVGESDVICMVKIQPYNDTFNIIPDLFWHHKIEDIDRWKFSKFHSMWFLKYQKVYISMAKGEDTNMVLYCILLLFPSHNQKCFNLLVLRI